MNSVWERLSHKTLFPFYQFIKQAKQRYGDRYKLTNSLEAKMTTSVLDCILRTNGREFKRFAKQIHGNQYKLIHLRLEAKMATSVLECILRAVFLNSNVLQPRSRPRVRRQGVFALTFIAIIQRTPHSRPCSLYTSHLQFVQWSCYISIHAPPSDSLPSSVVESAELFHRNTHNQLGDVGESGDPLIKILLSL